MLFKGTSSQEGGTLFQLRNLINRRNVVTKVKTDMNATEDFFEVITASHIVAVTLHTCGMTNLEDTPHTPPFDVNIDELSPHQKWLLLSTFIQGILEHHVKPTMEIEGLQGKAKKRKGDSDHVWECACVVLSTGLFMAEFKDAVREGDEFEWIGSGSICFYTSEVPARQNMPWKHCTCNFRNSHCHLAFRSSCCGQDL